MLTPLEFDQLLQQVEYDRAIAESDELATLEDRVWAKMTVASRHALLVRRFEALSATERNYAARMSNEPGGGIRAETARVRAAELLAIAERHRDASEQIFDEGQKLLQEAAPMLEQQHQQHEQQQGSGQHQGSGQPRRRPRQPPNGTTLETTPTGVTSGEPGRQAPRPTLSGESTP